MSVIKNIPMIDLPRVQSAYGKELNEAVQTVIDSGSYIGGPAVRRFEEEFTKYNGATCFGVGNGTDALQIALMALDIGPGDEVIVPAFTYAASAEVIGLLGATAVWCDVLPDSFNIDPASAKLALSAKTKAVIAVHLYGQLADLESLIEVVGNIPVIEDTAQAFGAKYLSGKYEGKYAGTVGAFGTISFFPTKPLGALGDGGAVICSDEQLYNKALSIARHGQSQKYVHDLIGVNSRLDPIQAAILSVKLTHFDNTLIKKQELYETYVQNLSALEQVVLPYTSPFSSHVWHQFTLKVSGDRDDLQSFLKSQGISSMVYYPIALSDQKAYASMIERIPIPVSRSLCNEVLSLPIDPSMTLKDVEFVCDAIKSYYQR